MMKVLIKLIWFTMIFIVFSCKNTSYEKNRFIENKAQNEISSKGILKKIELDNGLKVLLFRDTLNNSKGIVFSIYDSLILQKMLPTSLDYSGFSLNYLKRDGDYLLLSLEHGTKYYYQTDFYFSLNISSPFALEKLHGKNFDKATPNKWNEKDSILNISIPIEKFDLEYFLDNGW